MADRTPRPCDVGWCDQPAVMTLQVDDCREGRVGWRIGRACQLHAHRVAIALTQPFDQPPSLRHVATWDPDTRWWIPTPEADRPKRCPLAIDHDTDDPSGGPCSACSAGLEHATDHWDDGEVPADAA